MAISRSTFYDAPVAQLEEAGIITQIRTICDEFEYTAIAVSAPRFAIEASSSIIRSFGD